MLATIDNGRKRATAAAEVMTAEEAAKWFTRPELAAALKVSISTIDRMVKSEDLPCARMGRRVLFYMPDVSTALRNGNRKFGRAACVPAGGNPKTDQSKSEGNPNAAVRTTKEAR
jgi:excisionase family DNA binding protein